jgi:hypothetical protein
MFASARAEEVGVTAEQAVFDSASPISPRFFALWCRASSIFVAREMKDEQDRAFDQPFVRTAWCLSKGGRLGASGADELSLTWVRLCCRDLSTELAPFNVKGAHVGVEQPLWPMSALVRTTDSSRTSREV